MITLRGNRNFQHNTKNIEIKIEEIEEKEKEKEKENEKEKEKENEKEKEKENNENNENNQIVLQEIESDRPTEVNNNANPERYTEVEDYLSTPIEGFSNNNINNLNLENIEKEGTKAENSSENSKDKQNPLYNSNIQTYNLKIIVLGDIAVGKTSVIGRYMTNTFSEEHKSSISCEFKNKKIILDGETSANLQIWDTAGEERFMSVTRQYYNDSNGAIVIYDLTNKDTFLKMHKWIKELKDNAPKDIIISVVVNKSDLVNEKVDLGEELTPFKKDYLYCEVSAKHGTNVSLAFENLTNKIIEKMKEKKEKGEKIEPRDSVPLKRKTSSSSKKPKKCHC